MGNRLKGIICLLITAIIWGGAFIAQIFGGNAVGSFSFVAFRSFVGSIFIAIFIFIDNYKKTGKIIFFRKDENKKATYNNSLKGGIVLAVAILTQQIGAEITDVAKAGFIASLEVICVPIFMMFIYKRKLSFFTWIFVFTSMVGIMLLSINSISGINIGDIYVAISTLLYSYTIIQVDIYLKTVDPLKLSFFRFIVVGIISFTIAIFVDRDTLTFKNIIEGLPSILYTGILASGVAYTLQIIGQQYCEPVIATLIMGLEGVFAAILGWIILGQSLTQIQIWGCLIALVSTSIVQVTDYFTNK